MTLSEIYGSAPMNLLDRRDEPLNSKFNPSGIGPGISYGTLASLLMDFVPGIGDIQSVMMSLADLHGGNYGSAALGAAGALPVIGGFDLMPKILGMNIGKNAKTWDVLMNEKALRMASEGASERAIFEATGNWLGPDGKWRQEIPDNLAKATSAKTLSAKDRKAFNTDAPRTTLADVYKHQALYDAYPDAAKLRAYVMRTSGGDADFTRNSFRFDPSLSAEDMNDIITHEIQHWIQQQEGFPGGYRGSDASPFNPEYKNTAGEAEARAVQRRRKMSSKERSLKFPIDDYDVPIDALIFR